MYDRSLLLNGCQNKYCFHNSESYSAITNCLVEINFEECLQYSEFLMEIFVT